MRYSILIAVISVSLGAQSPPNCTGVARDIDARCGCVKDPGSKLCEMVKAGFYDSHDLSKAKPINLGLGSGISQPRAQPSQGKTSRGQTSRAQAARPQQARVVPLAHKDYLRFVHPNAQLVVGIDFEKVFRSPELMGSLFGQTEGTRDKVLAALKEMDHLWLSFTAPSDGVLLMTGKFEQGAAAGIFYAQGIAPVFLGGANAMMVGAEPSIQAALARLAKPAATDGWAARRARELSKDHEMGIVNEPPPGTSQGSAVLQPIRQFALGFRLSGEAGIDAEAVLDSEASAEKIAVWIDLMKGVIREKTGVGALDSLAVERAGSTLRFTAKGDALLAGNAGQAAMSSDFGVELYSVMMAGFPWMPANTVAKDKLLAVKEGMKQEEVLSLLGRPLAVSSIQGMETPRETWTYQVPFGKKLTLRLDGGVVTGPPR